MHGVLRQCQRRAGLKFAAIERVVIDTRSTRVQARNKRVRGSLCVGLAGVRSAEGPHLLATAATAPLWQRSVLRLASDSRGRTGSSCGEQRAERGVARIRPCRPRYHLVACALHRASTLTNRKREQGVGVVVRMLWTPALSRNQLMKAEPRAVCTGVYFTYLYSMLTNNEPPRTELGDLACTYVRTMEVD